MRIVVDLNRCLGYAQCVPLAPEVFKLSGEEALTITRTQMTVSVCECCVPRHRARYKRSSSIN
jgi:ferredoxin